jgi:hypothetical protein
MQILKAARVAASDIVGVSAATSGRFSTSGLLCSEDIQAVSSNVRDGRSLRDEPPSIQSATS